MFEGTGDERAWRSANERPFNPGMRLRNAELVDAKLRLPKGNENVTLMRYALVANAVSAQSLSGPAGSITAASETDMRLSADTCRRHVP